MRKIRILMSFFLPSSKSLEAYLKLGRFHSLTGAGYLLIPCWWGLFLAIADKAASEHAIGSTFVLTSLLLMMLFALGAIFMRACGCAWNDLLDRKIDAQSLRTRSRPLASGVLSAQQAGKFIMLLLVASALILLCVIALAPNLLLPILLLAVVPFAMLYPLAKRITYFPQVVLGCVFNWGVLCGFVALRGEVTLGAGLLFAAAVCWTIVYDTIYAFQDLDDDKRTGMKSLTFLLPSSSAKKILSFLYWIFLTMTALSIYIVAGRDSQQQLNVSIILTLGSIYLIVWVWFLYDIRRLNFAQAGGCMKFFKRELWRGGGGVLCALLAAGFL